MLTQVRGSSTLPDVEISLLHFTLESEASKRTACAGRPEVWAVKNLSARREQGGILGARGVDVARWPKQSQDRHTATGPWRCLARLCESDMQSTENASPPQDQSAASRALRMERNREGKEGPGRRGVAERRGMARRVWRWGRGAALAGCGGEELLLLLLLRLLLLRPLLLILSTLLHSLSVPASLADYMMAPTHERCPEKTPRQKLKGMPSSDQAGLLQCRPPPKRGAVPRQLTNPGMPPESGDQTGSHAAA